jgi:hypothetical protein
LPSPIDVSVCEVSISEIGAVLEFLVLRVETTKGRIVEDCTSQRGVAQIRAIQAGTWQVDAIEASSGQDGAPKVAPAEVQPKVCSVQVVKVRVTRVRSIVT